MTHGRARRTLARSLLAGAVSLALTVPAAALAHAQSGGAGDAPAFTTSFESGQQQPDWTSTAETGPDGKAMLSGVTAGTLPVLGGSVKDKIAEVTTSGDNPPNETAQKAADEDPNTKWLTFASTGWLQYRLSEDVTVKKYALTSANDFPNRDPKDWALQGSSDGSTWTTVDSRTGQTFDKRFSPHVYQVTDPGAYRYYRLNVTANNGSDGTQLADLILSDGSAPPPPVAGMTTAVGSGPSSGPNVRPNTGFTGVKALEYAGTHTAAGAVHAYNKLYDVHIPVARDTRLSYDIFPELTGGDLKYPSTYASVDLHFTDGTYLSGLTHQAQDQNGVALNPKAQGTSKILYASQWNTVASLVGQVAAGKTIDRILLGYDDPQGSAGEGTATQFKGWIDDLTIGTAPPANTSASYARHVDTRRGTNSSGSFSRGNNLPLTGVPNGFNFFTPVTDAGSTSWEYSYAAQNNADNLPTLQALGISHEPSPWMGDRDTFQVMPSAATGTPDLDRSKRALAFEHKDEVAQPQYYGVTFKNGIKAEIAPTDHAAEFRFTFPGDTGDVLFDNVNNNGGLTFDAAAGTLDGYSDVNTGGGEAATRMYVHGEFDRTPGTATKVTGQGRDNVTGYAQFDTSGSRTVTLRIATSFIGADQAKKNLDLEIPKGTSFDTVEKNAERQWNAKLGKVEVQGASDDQLTTLYSNLYRMNLYPNSGSENTGTAAKPVYRYASPFSPATGSSTPTQTGAKIVDGQVYVNNGFWDTYRSEWPAYSLLESDTAGKLADGFVQQYKDGGWTSRWSSPGYADLMTGTSSDVAFADAFAKGVDTFDAKAAYAAAVKNATVVPTQSGVGRKGLDTSEFTGYTNTAQGGSVSWSLDGYINDYGIGTMAAKLAKDPKASKADRQRYQEESDYFLARALNYTTIFNKNVGFFEGRNADGSWRVPDASYDPQQWGNEYTETNAWNYAFTVPQDPNGLAALYGGQQKLEQKLDTFFATQETADGDAGGYGGTIHEMIEARDVRMGELGLSNQPSFGIPYMYDYAGAPAKTQAVVREAQQRLFTGSSIGQGYPGDEDNGATSTWQIFSALGFYPLQVGNDNYMIGSPLFTKATVHLDNGRSIVVNAPNNSRSNVYVQSLKVNGDAWDKTYLNGDQLRNGAVLDFTMGSAPSSWGTGKSALPPSLTPAGRTPDPLTDTTGTGLGTGKAADGTDVSGLFDDTSATRVTFSTATPVIDYAYAGKDGGPAVARKAAFYTLTSGATAGADPKSWQLQGSNDGSHWKTLDSRSGETFTDRLQTRPFEIADPGSFTSYRLVVTGNSGAATTSLAELEILAH
ncbi:GH92 family glycosyl hydrolase [Actinacidiphila rubida]|uniref:Alpha-1,2-mannosidase, putative n=1 Tax=Actinacidiphila rubida TaxID=310780 RepID=A0A1H8NRH8_9ACTN|nr:GH92 family glycosyl hydrolase [Actinacidiphila rubida]SEO32234.1 alpha-1,2-mannosidase, putative [Actinacidiphila rubida]